MAKDYIESLTELDEDSILRSLNEYAQELGLIKEVFETSRYHIHHAVFARVFGHIIEILGQYLENDDIDDITDEALLDRFIYPFIQKQDAQTAKVILKFSRRQSFDGETSILTIPRNFEVRTEADDTENSIVFRTAEARIMMKNTSSVLIPAYSVEVGAFNNIEADTLVFFDDNEYFDQIEVTNPNPAYGGRDEETAFDARQRIDLFRYRYGSTKDALMELLYENGVSYYASNIVEYYNGFGTILICMDLNSEEEFNDIIAAIEAQKAAGVEYAYAMAEHIYININVSLKLITEQTLTPYEQDEIENDIQNAVELFFSDQIYVGKNLSINRLESYILQYLFDQQYDIYEVDVTVDNNSDLTYNQETNQLQIEEFQRLTPNVIYTTIEYNIL